MPGKMLSSETLLTVFYESGESKIIRERFDSRLLARTLTFYREILTTLLKKQQKYNRQLDIPGWLTVAWIIFISKNKELHVAKTSRPITCLNVMYKLYTGCRNMFLQNHCQTNGVITEEYTV